MIDGKITDELSSLLGAQRLAERIIKYWHDAGFPQVQAWVAGPVAFATNGAVYTVKTNLDKNGNPPKIMH